MVKREKYFLYLSVNEKGSRVQRSQQPIDFLFRFSLFLVGKNGLPLVLSGKLFEVLEEPVRFSTTNMAVTNVVRRQ